jgi:predicted glycosyltransferase
MMDEGFRSIFSTESEKSIDAVKKERQKSLYDLFKKEAPDLFIIELYPFGRKAFRFELDPVLEGIRNGILPPCRVVYSLRDVLVEKRDAASYENRVLGLLNRYFDALMIHSDPKLLTLDDTFSRIKDISVPIVYTGFVTPRPGPGAGKALREKLHISEDDRLIVASAGGGKVGGHVLKAVVAAYPYLTETCHMQIFTGPFMTDADYTRLKAAENRQIRVGRFAPDFLSFLAAADLSVSMAGYNTSMNIMAAKVPALLCPFAQNREQRLRAERLARFGGMHILKDADLAPKSLAALMERMIAKQERPAPDIDLNGATNTATWLDDLMTANSL